jgi:hypothetical protein
MTERSIERSVGRNYVPASELVSELISVYSSTDPEITKRGSKAFGKRIVSALAQTLRKQWRDEDFPKIETINTEGKRTSERYFSLLFIESIKSASDFLKFRESLETYKISGMNEKSFEILKEAASQICKKYTND